MRVRDARHAHSARTRSHMKLRREQFARVRHLDCFMSRVVSVCYGFEDEYGRCVVGSCDKALGLANPCLPSDYRRSQYVALNWAKWPLFMHALRVAKAALWLEADVVILRNPWEALLTEPQLGASVHDAVRYQYETPPCTIPRLVQSDAVSCSRSNSPHPHPEPLNCGQLLVRAGAWVLRGRGRGCVCAARARAWVRGSCGSAAGACVWVRVLCARLCSVLRGCARMCCACACVCCACARM